MDQRSDLKLRCRKPSIIRYLTGQQCSQDLAMKLHIQGLISDDANDKARNYAPHFGEKDRIEVVFDAVLAQVKLNPDRYTAFLDVLKTIDTSGDLVNFIDKALTEDEIPKEKPQVDIKIEKRPDGSIDLICIPSNDVFPIIYMWVNQAGEFLGEDAKYTALRAGTYRCTAINRFGSTSEEVRIEKPSVQSDSDETDIGLRVVANKLDASPVPEPYGVSIDRKHKSVTVTWKQHAVRRGEPAIAEYLVEYKYSHDNWSKTNPRDVDDGDDNWQRVQAGPEYERKAKLKLFPDQPYAVRVYAKNANHQWSDPCKPRTDVKTRKTVCAWINSNPKEFITIVIGIITIALLTIGLIVSNVL